MSMRDGHEWNKVALSNNFKCCQDGCGKNAKWDKILIACDKSSYDGGMYCEKHAAEEGNFQAQDKDGVEQEDRYTILFNAAIEAVEHMAQANWDGREKAARIYLSEVFRGTANAKSLDKIQKEINHG